MNHSWHSLSFKEIFQILETSEHGITKEQAEKRIKEFGKNKLPKKDSFSILKVVIEQFKSPLVYILIVAATISLVLKEFVDMWIILAAVFINAGIGFFQEYKAEKTFSHLKEMVTYTARVWRKDSPEEKAKEHIINNEEVVPGDIISLEAGDIVPADARLIESNNLKTKEALLTGESIPSKKISEILDKKTSLADRENMVYMGTTVTRGKAKAIIVNTGINTELGKIASLIKTTRDDKTPLQKKIGRLAKIIGIIITGLCLVLFISGIIIGRPFFEMLLISVAVAVAGIPEGLAISVTVCLAVGMQRVLKRKALTRKLIAAETLGSITVICSDKTGTLTEGKMSIDQIINYKDVKTKDLLEAGLLCNNVIVENEDKEFKKWKINGDTTEIALLKGALKNNLKRNELLEKNPRLDEIPFESEIMYMATLHKTQDKNNNLILVKGAPEKIINFCHLDKNSYQEIKETFEKLTAEGLRVLAFAQKKVNQKEKLKENINNLEFMGLIALKDPLRKNAKETIVECQKAGIRPVIITGDHKLTAKNVAEEIGLIKPGEKIILGTEMDQMSDKELSDQIQKIKVFARVEPKHKIRIVDLLQKKGEVVAMTGDGVNDAPAIKSADIGVSLGDGSEVTKETADIVLLNNNFKVIVDAIKIGRNIFDNIKKIVLFLFTDTFAEFILIGGALLLGYPLPILAGQILWVNIIEDTLPAMALSYEKEDKKTLEKNPFKNHGKILDNEMKFLIFVIGIITNFVLLGLFIYLYEKNFPIEYVRTMIFVGLGIDTLFYVFSCKNLKKTIWHYNPFNNLFLNISVIIGWGLFLIALYVPFFEKILRVVPLKISDWAILIGLGLFQLILIELSKLIFIKPRFKE